MAVAAAETGVIFTPDCFPNNNYRTGRGAGALPGVILPLSYALSIFKGKMCAVRCRECVRAGHTPV
jgi:hypothetical protein